MRSNALNLWEDCNRLWLPFYTAFQAAIRWCGLGNEEARIIAMKCDDSAYVKQGEFPEYPCMFLHSESIRMAMVTGKLRYDCDGNMVEEKYAHPGVKPQRRTMSHDDLKDWIRKEHPADVQKPHMAWLFDDVERSIHPSVTTDAYAILKSENDNLRAQLNNLKQTIENGALGTRERTTLLCIIGTLAKSANMDLSQPMKMGDAVAALIPDVQLSGRTIGDHLKRVSEALESRRT